MKKFIYIIVLGLFFICLINKAYAQEFLEITDEQVVSTILDGNSKDLEKLIISGLNVNDVYECATPLILAIKSSMVPESINEDSLRKIQLLLKAGADINQETCFDNARFPLTVLINLPLEINAMAALFNKTLDEEIKSGQDMCEIPGIIAKPCKDITLKERENIRITIQEAFTEQQKAIVPQMMNILQVLVENGADINKKDSIRGRTALHHAAVISQNVTLAPLKYLIEKGADLNAQDIKGNTPLFFAFATNNTLGVDMLIKAGADPSIRNKDGLLYNEVYGYRKPLQIKKEIQQYKLEK